ncbi:Protein transport protein SEC1 [Cyberlindnera fabianii]|uniref:Protein transport protein SEC1 n=1 Tax=Cyberlindnera fabianii TaxID=36022 RepID=A0A1V2L9Y1_CYBFA|nr:Protein transport protein SEC1 [Cyberlindnera fabianii]
MTSLVELQRNYILNTIHSVQTANGFKVLVLDDTTESLILDLVTKSELLKLVAAVEKIDKPRNTSSLEAVYILEPSRYSVNCLLTDYKVVPIRYRAAHIFFLPGLSPDLTNLIKANNQLTKTLKTFDEFKYAINPKESFVFTTRNPQGLQIFYNGECHSLVTKAIATTAHALVYLCVLTGEYPIIRYYEPNENDGYFNASILPKMIATEFQNQLDDYTRDHSDFPPSSTRQRSVFVITDRTMDLFAPLLHEFTYQAMASDISPDVNGDVYKYQAEDERGKKIDKVGKLNDKDPDWLSLRHLHIMEAQTLFNTRFEEFLSKNAMFIDRSKIKDTSDLAITMARMDGFDEERRRIVMHKTLIESLMLSNHEKKLAEIAEYEQNLADLGVDIDGEKVKNLADQLIEFLANDIYDFFDKIRVIILYGLYRGGLIEKDYIKLLNFMGILSPHDIQNSLSYIKNFEIIGFKLLKPNLKSKSIFKRDFLHECINVDTYNTSRFRPSMNTVITKIISNTLEDTLFPYTKDKPMDEESDISRTYSTSTTSLRNPKHKAAWARTNTQFQAPRQRIFYFIAGGATASELRTAYELSAKFEKDVIIGSDEIITPVMFLKQVHNLTVPRANLNLHIDWLMNRPSEPPKELLEMEKKRAPAPSSQQQQQQMQQQTNPSNNGATFASSETPAQKSGKRDKFKRFFKS